MQHKKEGLKKVVMEEEGESEEEEEYWSQDTKTAMLLAENRELKRMLLSQLDVIQRQSEAIQAKDKRLRELQRQNELLQRRLASRNRVVNRTKKTLSSSKTSTTATTAVTATTATTAATATTKSRDDRCLASFLAMKDQIVSAPVSKKPLLLQDSLNKTQQEESSSSSFSSLSSSSSSYLHTHLPYYTCRGEDYVRRERTQLRGILSKCEVPGWRIINIPRAYCMEGTENIEDESVLKRHFKLEMDEKRRKKWDIQRIRRQAERLRAQDLVVKGNENLLPELNGSSIAAAAAAAAIASPTAASASTSIISTNLINNSQKTLLSSFVNVDSITHISVSDRLPVSVFGAQLPLMPHKAFTLD